MCDQRKRLKTACTSWLLCPWNLTIITVNNVLMKMIIPNASETTFDSQTERTEQNSIMTVNVLKKKKLKKNTKN